MTYHDIETLFRLHLQNYATTHGSLMNEVVQTSPTLGSNVEEIVWKNIHFVMWDIGGQESLRQGWSAYYQNTEVCCAFNDLFF